MNLLLKFITEVWETTGQMAPYLLFGFLVAGVLSVIISPAYVEKHLGGRGLKETVKASMFGVPMPLCSCGVIPVSASLYRHGASRGATVSFLASTPQTGIDSVMVTWSLLGPVFTIFRVVVAFVTGVLCGSAVELFAREGVGLGTLGEQAHCANGGGSLVGRALRYGLLELPQDIGKSLCFGLILSGVIGALVPDNFFVNLFGEGGSVSGSLLPMVVMLVVGIPLYVCSTASVPMAWAFIAKGISPGAALVFLITGPATNAAAIATISKLLGRRTAIIYLSVISVCALIAGFVFNSMAAAAKTVTHVCHAEEGIGYFEHISAVVLIILLLNAIYQGRKRVSCCGGNDCDAGEAEEVPQSCCGCAQDVHELSFKISGMNCNHCVKNITRIIEECEGVTRVEVTLNDATAVVKGQNLDPEPIVEAIKSLGFGVE